jgi:hypothetical protein
MPSTSGAQEVRQAVQELRAEAYRFHKRYMCTLHRSFVQTARRHPLRFAMADGRTPKLSFGGALTRTIFLARRLAPIWGEPEMVGILLLPSVPGALVNLGKGWLTGLGIVIAVFEVLTVLVLRAHYTMDVFTGIVTGCCAAQMAERISSALKSSKVKT